jgi:hypothetical protein
VRAPKKEDEEECFFLFLRYQNHLLGHIRLLHFFNVLFTFPKFHFCRRGASEFAKENVFETLVNSKIVSRKASN